VVAVMTAPVESYHAIPAEKPAPVCVTELQKIDTENV
jgi:hypothetical protein